MTSLFTQFVARAYDVPAIDPRLIAHIEALAVVTQDAGPAAPVVDVNADQAPALQTS